jgi:hypothetical protein
MARAHLKWPPGPGRTSRRVKAPSRAFKFPHSDTVSTAASRGQALSSGNLKLECSSGCDGLGLEKESLTTDSPAPDRRNLPVSPRLQPVYVTGMSPRRHRPRPRRWHDLLCRRSLAHGPGARHLAVPVPRPTAAVAGPAAATECHWQWPGPTVTVTASVTVTVSVLSGLSLG